MPDLNDLEEIYFAALDRPATDRHEFLARACQGNVGLREAVERLLVVQPSVGRFLDPEGTASAPFPHTPVGGWEFTLSQEDEHVGSVLADRYRLVEVIGEGGMGRVYLAHQSDPIRRAVAVKVLKSGMDSKAVLARFEAERQALAVMDHPHIAKVFDAGTTPDGQPYFVMELVRGVPVTQFCDANRLTPRERLELFLPVCRAIQHAHQKGIIHRDIKPSNVLVGMTDGAAVPKVIDFGVAKAVGQPLADRTLVTGVGVLVGTPEYMSPEQAGLMTPDVDTRSDVYSLGVLLYELLTGTTPVDRRSLGRPSLLEILRLVREQDTPRPSTRLATSTAFVQAATDRGTGPDDLIRLYRRELDWIALRALEKDRDRRYDSAIELASDIHRYLTGEPVVAVPPTAGYRLRTLCRKHGRAVTAVAVVSAAVIGGGAVSLWQAIRATAAEHQAREHEAQAVAASHRATEEEAIARSLAHFLQNDLLLQADLREQDPDIGRSRNLTTRQLLDRAAGRIEGRFLNQERVEAKIRFTLGHAYFAVGEYQSAQDQLERTAALLADQLPPDHPEVLRTLGGLGRLYQVRGQAARAESILERVVAGYRRQRPANDVDLLVTTRNLARVYLDRGRYSEAEEHYQRSLDGLLESLGEKHTSTLTAMQGMADLDRLRGRFQAAGGWLSRLERLAPEVLGRDHPDAAALTLQFASLRRDEGRLGDAEKLFAQARDKFQELLGPDHPDTLKAALSHAQVVSTRGRYAAAEPLLQETLASLKLRLGEDDPNTLNAMNSLGVLHLRRGRPSDALPFLVGVVKKWRVEPGPAHPQTIDAVRNYAIAQFMTGHAAEARELFVEAASGLEARNFAHREATAILENVTGTLVKAGKPTEADEWCRKWCDAVGSGKVPQSPEYAATMTMFGGRLIEHRQWDEAECVLMGCMPAQEESPPNDWQASVARTLLGRVRTGQRRYAEAEPLLLAGFEGLKGLKVEVPKRDVRMAEAVDGIIELYVATGRNEDARAWRAVLAKYREVLPHPRKG